MYMLSIKQFVCKMIDRAYVCVTQWSFVLNILATFSVNVGYWLVFPFRISTLVTTKSPRDHAPNRAPTISQSRTALLLMTPREKVTVACLAMTNLIQYHVDGSNINCSKVNIIYHMIIRIHWSPRSWLYWMDCKKGQEVGFVNEKPQSVAIKISLPSKSETKLQKEDQKLYGRFEFLPCGAMLNSLHWGVAAQKLAKTKFHFLDPKILVVVIHLGQVYCKA